MRNTVLNDKSWATHFLRDLNKSVHNNDLFKFYKVWVNQTEVKLVKAGTAGIFWQVDTGVYLSKRSVSLDLFKFKASALTGSAVAESWNLSDHALTLDLFKYWLKQQDDEPLQLEKMLNPAMSDLANFRFERWNDTMIFRELKPDEYDLLKEFLYEAIFIPEGAAQPDRDIINQPELALYYEGFGSGQADHCIVAEDAGKVIGAVWTRIMNDYGHVDDDTPSFAISIIKDYRGHGVGTQLMKRMLLHLKECGFEKASLAVQKANYAVHLYETVGFKVIDENAEEYIMICDLQELQD